MAIDLSRFETFTLGRTTSSPQYISITRNGLSVPKSIFAKLSKADYVKIAINKGERLVAIIRCENENEVGRIQMDNTGKKRPSGFRTTNKTLIGELAGLLGADVRTHFAYKVAPEYTEENNAIIINLRKAKKFTPKNAGKKQRKKSVDAIEKK